jgi:hypothetical protein
MSRGVRRNAVAEASERHPKERPGLLSVNEKDLGKGGSSGRVASKEFKINNTTLLCFYSLQTRPLLPTADGSSLPAT